jgi:hypothetical protein
MQILIILADKYSTLILCIVKYFLREKNKINEKNSISLYKFVYRTICKYYVTFLLLWIHFYFINYKYNRYNNSIFLFLSFLYAVI